MLPTTALFVRSPTPIRSFKTILPPCQVAPIGSRSPCENRPRILRQRSFGLALASWSACSPLPLWPNHHSILQLALPAKPPSDESPYPCIWNHRPLGTLSICEAAEYSPSPGGEDHVAWPQPRLGIRDEPSGCHYHQRTGETLRIVVKAFCEDDSRNL